MPYKSRGEAEEEIDCKLRLGNDALYVHDAINTQRLSDLAAVREDAEKQIKIIDQSETSKWRDGYRAACVDHISFITSCENKLR